MPKKRTSSQFHKPSTPVHPSLSSSSSASKGHHHIPRSLHSAPATSGNLVNDLIQRQRSSFASPTPNVTQPSLSRDSLVQAQTLPPSLRSILQGPAALLPDPRLPHHISRRRVNRRPAGPPPPRSWVQQGDRLPQNDVMVDHSFADDESSVHEEENRYYPFNPLPGLSVPDEGSLQFQTLKSLALRWNWHLNHEWNHLAALPMKTKERILYFVAKYNPGMMTRVRLEALFLGDGSWLEDLSVVENPTHLDLGASLGASCSIYDIMNIFIRKPDHVSTFTQEHDSPIIPDAWDAPEAATPMYHHLPSFSCLTHLSLARPFKGCWKSLLRLAPHLATLTHLSLAYWPAPSFHKHSYAENRSVCFFLRTKIVFGNGPEEAPKILRRLSRATYCLQWLDLTGCCGWLWALQCTDGPDWAGSWRGVQMVQAGHDQRPPFDIQSGVNDSLDLNQVMRDIENAQAPRMDFFELSHWVWYARSIRKLEALVNGLRMTSSSTPRPQEGDDMTTIYEEQAGNAGSTTTTATSPYINQYTSTAPHYRWWHTETDDRIGAGLQLRNKRSGSGSDGRVVFQSSSDEEKILSEIIEAYHARGKRLEDIRFLLDS